MIVVNVVIEEGKTKKGEIGLHMECNLLKREDATKVEWLIARKVEDAMAVVCKAIDPKSTPKMI